MKAVDWRLCVTENATGSANFGTYFGHKNYFTV